MKNMLISCILCKDQQPKALCKQSTKSYILELIHFAVGAIQCTQKNVVLALGSYILKFDFFPNYSLDICVGYEQRTESPLCITCMCRCIGTQVTWHYWKPCMIENRVKIERTRLRISSCHTRLYFTLFLIFRLFSNGFRFSPFLLLK
jgi:hypothetical protein